MSFSNFGKIYLVAATMALGGLAAGDVQAAVLSAGDIGTTTTVNFTCDAGDPCPDATNSPSVDLSAVLELTLTNYGFSGGQTIVDFSATLFNTTLASTTSSRITSLGFGLTPDAVGVSVSDGNADGIDWSGDVTVGSSGGVPGFKSVIDLCVFATSSCTSASGGATNGIQSESSDVFDITLTFASELASFEISPFALKFASVSASGGGSYEFGDVVAPVPVPPAALALGLGLGALGFAGRRQRRRRT